MSLKDVNLKIEYRSLADNISKEFYIPLLSQAVSYKRAVGFFSSSSLSQIAKGVDGLVKNSGTIQLITSPHLSEEDVEAIRKGYEIRPLISDIFKRDLENARLNEFEKQRLNLLANLIANGILDIRIALTVKNGEYSMYHEKMGIISDEDGNKVAFSGSMNESSTAMRDNYEAIDVFCSWDDEQQRIPPKEKAFEAIWNGTEPNIKTLEFPELKDELIKKYKTSDINTHEDIEEISEIVNTDDALVSPKKEKVINGMCIPEHVNLHDYQKEAIQKWKDSNFCGIFDMATGTGKTFTGLGAVATLTEQLNGRLAVFIVCPYQHLVEQWVEDIKLFNGNPIIGYSASSQKDWKERLKDDIRDQKVNVTDKDFFVFITTNATFASTFVQEQIKKIKCDSLLLIDEAHNFGAEHLSTMLSDKFKYRLALSATLNRHNDEEGTQALYDYFGEKCIDYPLERAIEEKKLTKYNYYPIICTLSKEELEVYKQLSNEIKKCLIIGKNKKTRLNEKGKILALKRARLVAGATDKLVKLEEEIIKYKNDKHILVYCGATKVLGLKEDNNDDSFETDDQRQIDAVSRLLGNKLNMKVSHFTSREDNATRSIIKKNFSDGERLQALIAIKCLDEGVNIPQIKTAFILASTTNPKEYIQRRGRVLRLAKGKEYAEIYDFITLPRPLDIVKDLTQDEVNSDLSLVNNELCRISEFARISSNRVVGQQIIDLIKESYNLNVYNFEFKENYND